MDRYEAIEWCELNLGRTFTYDGQQATMTGYGPSDGRWWATVELDDGSETECLVSDLALPAPYG